jgi:crotonobetainyl-CoA:carnitine CoA-transferase CaiB-like acyl-CoA transferase
MGWIAEIDHPTLGRFETLGTPFHVYGADIGPRGPAPDAGAHTFEVLAELGVADDELSKLAVDGVIG